MQPWREEISLASIAIKYCFSARYRLSVFQYLPQHRGNRIQYDFIFIFAVLRTETFYILVCCMSKHIGKNCVISYRSSFSIENYWKMFLKTFFPFARLFCIFFIHERSFYWITFAATITKSQSLNWNCFERKWFWIHTHSNSSYSTNGCWIRMIPKSSFIQCSCDFEKLFDSIESFYNWEPLLLINAIEQFC